MLIITLSGCEESKQVWHTQITNDYPKLSSVPCRPNLPELKDVETEKKIMEKQYNNP